MVLIGSFGCLFETAKLSLQIARSGCAALKVPKRKGVAASVPAYDLAFTGWLGRPKVIRSSPITPDASVVCQCLHVCLCNC